MLCVRCQERLQQGLSPTLTSYSPGHHPTYQSLEKSIDEGCYVCSRFWEALSVQERGLISSADCTVESSKDGFSTSTSLIDGKNYGHPGCYLFNVAYNMPSVYTAPTARRRACFLLEPAKGWWLHISSSRVQD